MITIENFEFLENGLLYYDKPFDSAAFGIGR